MMEPNIFAILTPIDEKDLAATAFRLPHNAARFRHGTGGVLSEPMLGSREPTPAPDEGLEPVADAIILLLDQDVKDPEKMWQFGTNPETSDVLLGCRGTPGISGTQYNLTIDDEYCIWLHDFHSSFGTAVGYNSQQKDEVRRKESWILSYKPGSKENHLSDITIHTGGLVFRIEFPNHHDTHPDYVNHLQAFVRKCRNTTPLFGALHLHSNPLTQEPSHIHTPSSQSLYLDLDGPPIGEGAFGLVRKVIRLRDGKSCAAKCFRELQTPRNPEKRKRDKLYWHENLRHEFDMLKNNPHPYIVPVLDFIETPGPAIIMELYPLGNIDQVKLPDGQYVTAFAQLLMALQHLHDHGIVHRDLKGANILVKKHPLTIAIADFGLSKTEPDDSLLKTVCGTVNFVAPEVYGSAGYGCEVDIWSAGVLMLEWTYRLPKCPDRQRYNHGYEWHDIWSREIHKHLSTRKKNRLTEILDMMIEHDPYQRWTATRCLLAGRNSGLFKVTADGRTVGAEDPEEVQTPIERSVRRCAGVIDIFGTSPKPSSSITTYQASFTDEDTVKNLEEPPRKKTSSKNNDFRSAEPFTCILPPRAQRRAQPTAKNPVQPMKRNVANGGTTGIVGGRITRSSVLKYRT